tara:strand:- start:313 stop:1344 length:1032 start_codon:yes stop_codon:yes gene_type:complete
MRQSQRIPHLVEFGKKAISANELNTVRAVVVHGNSAASLQGLETLISGSSDRHVRVNANTLGSVQDICDFASSLEDHFIDAVVGIGGGAVMDKAKKLGGTLRANGVHLEITAIPTLPGSGVESSKAVVINEDIKVIEVSNFFMPDKVIYDFQLISEAGIGRLICGAHDAVIHGLESLFSAFSNPISSGNAHGALGKFHQISALCANISDFSNSEILKLVPELCSLSFAGGVAQSEAGAGPIHAMAHTVEADFGGSHANLIRSIARRAFGHYAHATRLQSEVQILTSLAKSFETLSSIENVTSHPIMADQPTAKFLKRMKSDPCWRTAKVRFSDDVVREILSGV